MYFFIALNFGGSTVPVDVERPIYIINHNVLYFTETYKKGIEKLITAQDTSNVENNEISSEELREKKKQKRRINAKRIISSSSSEEEDKENRQIQNKKRLPSLPKLQDFVSVNTVMENIVQDPCTSKNVHKEIYIDKTNNAHTCNGK